MFPCSKRPNKHGAESMDGSFILYLAVCLVYDLAASLVFFFLCSVTSPPTVVTRSHSFMNVANPNE